MNNEIRTRNGEPFDFTQGLNVRGLQAKSFVNSIADLKALDHTKFTNKIAVEVLGYYTPGDNGGGIFYWDIASSEIDNSGTIIRPINNPTTGRWIRNISDQINVKDFGASSSASTATNTLAMQRAIDYVSSIGGGVVSIPQGTYNISASFSPDTWEVYGAGAVVTTIGPGACCLILREGVYLVGSGEGQTILLMPANTTLDGIYVEHSPNGYGISDLTLDGGWDRVTEVNSHGIYWIAKMVAGEGDTRFTNGIIRNVAVQNVGSYGFGLEAGSLINNLFDNIRVTWAGADGIDAKNHNDNNRGNKITGAVISAFGLRTSLLAQAGIDLRGDSWLVSGARIINFGRADTTNYGIRLNATSSPNGEGGRWSSITDFYVAATDSNTVGVSSSGENNNIGPGNIFGCETGVWLKYNSIDSVAINNTVIGVDVEADEEAPKSLTLI